MSLTLDTIIADQVQGKTNCDDIYIYTINVFRMTVWVSIWMIIDLNCDNGAGWHDFLTNCRIAVDNISQ